MISIGFYCDPNSIEANALDQLQQYARKPYIQTLCAFTDVHYCQERALPVGVAFSTKDYIYPLITGKDIGCGVMYLKVDKAYLLKPFDKKEHYKSWSLAHQQMTDDGLGGGNHFLSIEEDEEAVYIICHTGTRDRGIALYQQCLELTREYALASGSTGNQDFVGIRKADAVSGMTDYIHKDFLSESFRSYYEEVLHFGYERRKNFCIKTLIFLQNAGYVRSQKAKIDRAYLKINYGGLEEKGVMYGTPFELSDSIHNHIRITVKGIVHRKGSTELQEQKIAVIPLSMSRGSLLVKAVQTPALKEALSSCAHGAGRRLSRFDAMKHWRTVLKEKERKAYKARFSELLGRNGEFPSGYIQEFDFAYKDASGVLTYHPYLKQVTKTQPIATIKFSEI